LKVFFINGKYREKYGSLSLLKLVSTLPVFLQLRPIILALLGHQGHVVSGRRRKTLCLLFKIVGNLSDSAEHVHRLAAAFENKANCGDQDLATVVIHRSGRVEKCRIFGKRVHSVQESRSFVSIGGFNFESLCFSRWFVCQRN